MRTSLKSQILPQVFSALSCDRVIKQLNSNILFRYYNAMKCNTQTLLIIKMVHIPPKTALFIRDVTKGICTEAARRDTLTFLHLSLTHARRSFPTYFCSYIKT